VRAAGLLGMGVAALVAGCGAQRAAFPPLCGVGPDRVLRALERAPGPVRLADGTRLSACVAGARSDAEIQSVGFTLTPAAQRLADRATPEAALRLGYLVGAARRGSAHTNNIHAELLRKLEHTLDLDDPALVAAARRGLQAGESGG
jgi:hypothetical protein